MQRILAALALGALVARPLAAQQEGSAPRPAEQPPTPAKQRPAPAPPPAPAPAPQRKPPPPPQRQPAPRTAPKPAPPAPKPPAPLTPEDERILRDLELFMLYEMLNDYEMFYDDDKRDHAR